MNADKRILKLMILVGCFMASILAANTLASKLFEVGGYVMTAGIIAFPITFVVTDVINDVYGRHLAQKVVVAGLFANILMLILYRIGMALPPAAFWEHQEAFVAVIGEVPRVVLASMLAYIISQTWDVWIFSRIKAALNVGLWFRNCASTITSQAIDSAIFLTVAFIGVMPASELVVMFVTYLIAKLLIALLDTPVVYLGVLWLQGGDAVEHPSN